MQQHHPIPFWGLDDIYKALKAPNGFKFTLCQVVMSIKSGVDYITPLFVAIDESMEREVVIVCDISMKAKAEGILSHLGIYVALVFGSVAWKAFAVTYKASMEPYQYCPIRRCAIERDTSTIASGDSFDCKFSKYGLSGDMIEIPKYVHLDPVQQITLHIYPDIMGILGDENGDSGTIRSDCSDATLAASKTTPFALINYLLPPPPSVLTAPSTFPNNTTTSKDDAPKTS